MGKGSGSCDRPAMAFGGSSGTAVAEAMPVLVEEDESIYTNPLSPNLGPTTLESTTLPAHHPAVIDAQKYPKRYNSNAINFEMVNDEASMQEMLKALEHPDVTRLALDIETTGEFVPWKGSIRMIQIGVEEPEPRQFLIDAWAIDPEPVMPFLANEEQEVIMCNGRYEQLHLLYRYNVKIGNGYDVAYTSQAITKTRNRSVGSNFKALMERYTGKRISKEEQNSGWSQPQLSLNQLRYAAMDVAGLLDIRRQMGLDTAQRGLQSASSSAFYKILPSTKKSLARNGQERTDQVSRLVRAINHARSPEEAEKFRSLTPRLPLTRAQVDIVNAAYVERIQQMYA